MVLEIHLEDLAKDLSFAHIKLDLTFLNKFLNNASKSNAPHREESFSKKIKCLLNKNKKSAMTIYGWMKGYRTIPLLKLVLIKELSNFSWLDLERNLISIKSGMKKGEIYPKFPIRIDEKLGSIVGHILGDGSIDKANHTVFFSNSNLELLKDFSDNMRSIFGVEPRIWVQDKPDYGKTRWLKRVYNFNNLPVGHNVGLFYPKICSDMLYSILDKFAEGSNKYITPRIKELGLNFKKGLIRAFFDDEGSVNSKSYTVRFHQNRRELLQSLINLLGEFNIKCNPIHSYLKHDKIQYYFNITSYNNYYNFYMQIGCISSLKKKQFEILIHNKE